MIALLCFIPAVIQVFTGWFDWSSPCYDQFGTRYLFCEENRPWFAGLHVYGWFLFAGLGAFAMFVDYCIYKRSKKDTIFFD
jgi:hypothetical protein